MENSENLMTERSIIIQSTLQSVWDVLTNPDKIKIYLFGSEAISEWKIGSPIVFQREFEGRQYRDKGTILEFNPGKILKFSYWSSQEGYPDIPENYSTISYKLHGEGTGINLTYRRENIPIEFERMNQERFLPGMLANIKKLAENG